MPSLASARELLAYLLLHRHRPHPRAVLVGLFWPNMPEAQARRMLSQALWHLRRSLPDEDILQVDVETLCIPRDAPIWTDVAAFKTLVTPHLGAVLSADTARTDLNQAVQLYRGDLLEGMYADWIYAKQRRLQELYHQVLEQLIHLEKQVGSYEQALKHALALVQADPLYEAAHREVMRLYVALGRPQSGLAQFNTCQQILKSELGLDPDPATIALAHEISQRTDTDVTPHLPRIAPLTKSILTSGVWDGQLPLVGRDTERDQLLTHMQSIFKTHQSRTGIAQGQTGTPQGGVVLVEGEAGVGKTRLFQELARDAEWRGALVLWGRGKEREAVSPFGPLVQALESGLSRLRATQLALVIKKTWLRALSQVIPSLVNWLPDLGQPAALELTHERERLVQALIHCLTGWSQITPLVLMLEDLHWADADTLDVLADLAHRLHDKSVLIIGNYRGEDARMQDDIWEKLQAIDRAGLCQRLCLSRLSETDTAELIRRTLGTSQPAALFEKRIYQETDGNPLFVLETLRVLCEKGLLFQDAEGHWSTAFDGTTEDYAELALAPGIERVIAQRVAYLPPRMRQLLQVLAVLGRNFDATILPHLMSQVAGDTLAILNTLTRWRFLIETPIDYQFSHDKIRQVVYDEIPADRRVSLHQHVANVMEAQAPEQIEVLAFHFTQGQVWDKAVTYTLLAAEQALSAHAYQAALDHYTCALRLLETKKPFDGRRIAELRFDVLISRCKLFQLKGDKERQRADLQALCQIANALSDPQRQVRALNQQALFMCRLQDSYDQARQTAQAALELARVHHLPRQQAIALGTIGQTHVRSVHHREAVSCFQQALALWQSFSDATSQIVNLYYWLSGTYGRMGLVKECEKATEALLAIAQEADEPLIVLRVYEILASNANVRGDYQTSIEHVQHALKLVRGHGLYEHVPRLLYNLALYYTLVQQYGKAFTVLLQALALSRWREDQSSIACCLTRLGQLYLFTGRYAKAQTTLAEALDYFKGLNLPDYHVWALCESALVHVEQGDVERAQRLWQQARDITDVLQTPEEISTVELVRGRIQWASGDVQAAIPHFAKALDYTATTGLIGWVPLYRSHLARCYLETGNLDQAISLSSQAMDELAGITGGAGLTRVYLYHWHIMQTAGRTAEARQALEKAHATLQTQKNSLLDPEWQCDFVENVSVNQDILQAYQQQRTAGRGDQITLCLACSDAGGRGRLRPEQRVTVTWTVNAPEDKNIPNKKQRRHHRLLRLMRQAREQGAVATVNDLAETLDVHESTIRRDLTALRQAGNDVFTRGQRP